MVKERKGKQKTTLGGAGDVRGRAFADMLGSILETACGIYIVPEELQIRFSVALVGDMSRDTLGTVLDELPVAATIALNEELGERGVFLTDAPTASALVAAVSSREPDAERTLSEEDINVLHDVFGPIVHAFSAACEETIGRPFGTIENIELSDPVSRERIAGQLPEALSRATISVTIGKDASGKMAFILPVNLMEVLAETATLPQESSGSSGPKAQTYEHVELKQSKVASAKPHELRETSMENIDLILDIQLKLTARLGQVEMPVGEIMELAPGSVIDIDRLVDEPVELVVNDRLIARGEIVVVQENFGIRITEIISPKDRIKSLR
ncbi:MAG: flagellar motor switch protein FliN [Candidatus Abyssobacteria bacterium SURF_17]|uniref:Flagellar motor switch protein FliN n=1 Tax=Candidatus Abyssobacteria bacterium SURF_17 TaxID=2093361 RepID=A0A419EXV7_9BACT|nr:MAG: flagellar motor switch protein FliN [Candidatus Abyssubacteria bacterium SURF_17]